MKALILAAGVGSRLAPLTNNMPKSLVEVNGKPILMKQIENLHQNGIDDITVVSGYMADILEKEVHTVWPEVRIIYNAEFAKTNNMYSAYIAKDIIGNEKFLMMNADVFFDPSVITALLSYTAPNAIVTEIGSYIEESMKVINQKERLVRISKDISKDEAFGVSIDVYKFSEQGAKAFFKKCTEYIEEKKERNLWSEVALNEILCNIVFKACPLSGRWLEIDNCDDLKAARELFSEKDISLEKQ